MESEGQDLWRAGTSVGFNATESTFQTSHFLQGSWKLAPEAFLCHGGKASYQILAVRKLPNHIQKHDLPCAGGLELLLSCPLAVDWKLRAMPLSSSSIRKDPRWGLFRDSGRDCEKASASLCNKLTLPEKQH